MAMQRHRRGVKSRESVAKITAEERGHGVPARDRRGDARVARLRGRAAGPARGHDRGALGGCGGGAPTDLRTAQPRGLGPMRGRAGAALDGPLPHHAPPPAAPLLPARPAGRARPRGRLRPSPHERMPRAMAQHGRGREARILADCRRWRGCLRGCWPRCREPLRKLLSRSSAALGTARLP